MDKDIKEDVKELVDAAKKVTKTAKEIGTEKTQKATTKSKEVAENVAKKAKKNATKLKKEIKDMFDTDIHTYIQFQGKEINQDEIVEKIKKAYKEEGNTKEVEKMNIYVKPEDNAVYYVINDSAAGKVDMF